MNKTVVALVAGFALGIGASWMFLHHPAEPEGERKAEASAAKPEEKPNPLRIPAAKRDQAGITLANPVPRPVPNDMTAFGRVLDATSLVTLAAEVETARAAVASSEQELQRTGKLHDAGGNASAQALETARASAARDRATLVSAQTRLSLTWGRTVAERLADVTKALENGGALIRIDVLPGETVAAEAREARVTWPGQTTAVVAELLGPSPVADPQALGPGYLALVHEGAAPAGAAVRATLPGSATTASALTVSRIAIVYHQGSAWLYVLGEEDTFERKLVTLGASVGDAVAVLSGVEADEQVAVTGAGQLLAAELQAGGAAEP
jgi:hypothetical protein